MTMHQPTSATARDEAVGGAVDVNASTGQPAAPTSAPRPSREALRLDVPVRVAGAAAALLVSWIHVVDQGGLTSLKHPAYVGVGYWLLELTAVAVAVVLLAGGVRQRLAAWWLALGVAAGPMVGYALSRGPGLPGYTEDRGNWTEQIGVQALLVETALLALAGWVLWRSQRTRR